MCYGVTPQNLDVLEQHHLILCRASPGVVEALEFVVVAHVSVCKASIADGGTGESRSGLCFDLHLLRLIASIRDQPSRRDHEDGREQTITSDDELATGLTAADCVAGS